MTKTIADRIVAASALPFGSVVDYYPDPAEAERKREAWAACVSEALRYYRQSEIRLTLLALEAARTAEREWGDTPTTAVVVASWGLDLAWDPESLVVTAHGTYRPHDGLAEWEDCPACGTTGALLPEGGTSEPCPVCGHTELMLRVIP